MKNLKWIFLTIALVVIIVGASVVYDTYMKNNGGGLIPTETTPKDDLGESPKDDPTPSDKTNEPNDTPNTEKVTMSAPDFTVINYDGEEVKLSDYVGKPIVLNFWATWCVYCKMEMPDFNKAYENYPDVVFLMVNATDGHNETVDTAKSYVETEGFSFTVLFDTKGEAENAYHITGWPTTYFLNAKGDIVARASGALSYETLEQGIAMIKE